MKNKYTAEVVVRKPGFWNGFKCIFGRDSRVLEFTFTGEGSLDELTEDIRKKVFEVGDVDKDTSDDDYLDLTNNSLENKFLGNKDLTKPQYSSSGAVSEASDGKANRLMGDKTHDVFNLSKRETAICYGWGEEPVYTKRDVKEFLKRLKKMFCRCRKDFKLQCEHCGETDKLAGDKLK